MSEDKPHLQVTAALIFQADQVLITRRAAGSRHEGRWEFPGGKQEPGEGLEACLTREIKEELDLDIEVGTHFLSLDHDYGDFSLTLHAFICKSCGTIDPAAVACCRAWVRPADLELYDLLPPDRAIAGLLVQGRDDSSH